MTPRIQCNMQQRRTQNYTGQQQQRNNQLAQKQISQKVRNLNEDETENTQETTEETIDSKQHAIYVKWWKTGKHKLHTISKIHRRKFHRNQQNEKRILDTNNNKQQANLLVSRQRESKKILEHRNSNLLANGTMKVKQSERSIGEFRCFNNNKINTLGIIQVDIKTH